MIKNLPANAGGLSDVGLITWVRKTPWSSKWQPTPVFLPGESHGQEDPGGLQSSGSQKVGHD